MESCPVVPGGILSSCAWWNLVQLCLVEYCLLQLRVSDGPHSGVPVFLTVNVEDVNDNWPRFEQTLYNVSVSEVST